MSNATDLFVNQAKSESFWTSIFCLYLLHLSTTNKEEVHPLGVWTCRESGEPKWFVKKKDFAFKFNELSFDNIKIESPIDEGTFEGLQKKLAQNCIGIKPDLFILDKTINHHNYDYILIENKTANQGFTWPQMNGYPELVEYLTKQGKNCVFLLLISVGNDLSFKGANDLQKKMENKKLQKKFGVLLWEDVFLKMHKNKFLIPGINIDWRKFTGALYNDAEI